MFRVDDNPEATLYLPGRKPELTAFSAAVVARQFKSGVAVGTPVNLTPPAQIPHVQDYCMRLLPRMFGVEAQIGIGMKDARFREPVRPR